MWRCIFLAIGIMTIIIGVESLLIDSAAIYGAADTEAVSFVDPTGRPSESVSTWRPSEAFPFFALMGGTVCVLYVFKLPGRFGRGEG